MEPTADTGTSGKDEHGGSERHKGGVRDHQDQRTAEEGGQEKGRQPSANLMGEELKSEQGVAERIQEQPHVPEGVDAPYYNPGFPLELLLACQRRVLIGHSFLLVHDAISFACDLQGENKILNEILTEGLSEIAPHRKDAAAHSDKRVELALFSSEELLVAPKEADLSAYNRLTGKAKPGLPPTQPTEGSPKFRTSLLTVSLGK